MSMPSIDLTCDKCSYKTSTMKLWGQRYYLVDGKTAHVSRQFGYCHDCDDVVPIESLELDELLDRINRLLESIAELKRSRLKLLFSSYRRKLLDSELSEVIILNRLITRQGTEKCLKCSSDRIEIMKGDFMLDYDIGGLYSGEKHTGMKHHKCGGEFVATPCGVRFNVRFTPVYYNLDGTKVG